MSKVKAIIGTHPVISSFITSVLFLFIFFVMMLIKIYPLALVMAIAFFVSLYFLLPSLFPCSIFYNRAKSAILSGQIDPDFSIHSSHHGIIMVDNKSRKIFVNYSPVLSFDDIIEIKWEDGETHGVIKIVTKSGRNPVREVYCHAGTAGENQFHRLTNALGFR